MIFIIVTIVCLISFILGMFVGSLRGIYFVRKEDFRWSIGIYRGQSPLRFFPSNKINNPVLTAKDVSDISADFIADPFMVQANNTWYMFFEVMNLDTKKGEIGFAQSDDCTHWAYKKIILNEPFHLSYPYAFQWENEYYMIPETYKTNSIRLYKAVDFPTQWSFMSTLVRGYPFLDTSVVYFYDKWWMFTAITNGTLHLYYSTTLTGPWILHPQSPVTVGDPRIARPGGRVIIFEDKIIRYAQDDSLVYGKQVLAFEITELTATSYKEREISDGPVLKASGAGWNAKGMHHIDPHQVSKKEWIACVDGYRESLVFRLRY